MNFPKVHTVDSFENLRSRVGRLLRTPGSRASPAETQADSELSGSKSPLSNPRSSAAEFLSVLCDALPHGEVYLFGGVLRDIALFGRRGFSSDIDVVVEGDWEHCGRFLSTLNARRNKFGGYRLAIADWPVDVWHARETWAVREGLVSYKSISSLTETTVLNWDAILMNWRSGAFVCRPNYLLELDERLLDVVLQENPNPVGMAARVFRHLCAKDARRITRNAASYLIRSAARYRFEDLQCEEMRSYGNSLIERNMYRLFERANDIEAPDVAVRFRSASELLQQELALPDPGRST